jgi:hypothetical protein
MKLATAEAECRDIARNIEGRRDTGKEKERERERERVSESGGREEGKEQE